MHDIEMIDFELWVISMIRAMCRREGMRLPRIGRADELLDERLAVGAYWNRAGRASRPTSSPE
ncbi:MULTISPECIES: hypothetical protein [unclassified Mycolicibacterium]|uniref:hypothetical protein n=1 Tax=unclassified Mycolicibacterium TaxID=2636767 RepID=UPI0012DBF371|nr:MULTISPECIES: hypothetical protein [unclassified Mycolicibacterium]MUL85792.1 hypothetical protein [Mycolicibacterium sp. CBMA 329]MUL90162.1 hypothetical protein [Mycolicibacterium sp. CBMA 331]MUM00931.1 hypothetical protein [Mycolicibacterium sp. CBMA 334]MUM27471.1 hypothetical protein [Mycolicibacterium sp. CBMA 295]MUM39677.1 hypothetical protein [Mycolicibacterium sp. CBMA 247]